jgi:hypothetical protein
VSDAAHGVSPSQQRCPLPPQVPQSPVPHIVPAEHAVHAVPPWPHALSLIPSMHASPAQQPAHDVGSQVHVPPTQRWPLPQLPSMQTPLQPSLAPHALPSHVGVQVPAAHTFDPPPPHVCPTVQPPQSTSFPHSRT